MVMLPLPRLLPCVLDPLQAQGWARGSGLSHLGCTVAIAGHRTQDVIPVCSGIEPQAGGGCLGELPSLSQPTVSFPVVAVDGSNEVIGIWSLGPVIEVDPKSGQTVGNRLTVVSTTPSPRASARTAGTISNLFTESPGGDVRQATSTPRAFIRFVQVSPRQSPSTPC